MKVTRFIRAGQDTANVLTKQQTYHIINEKINHLNTLFPLSVNN